MKKVFFSCQNAQELDDISLVALELKKKYGICPILYDISNVTGGKFSVHSVARFSGRYEGFRIFKREFKFLSPFQRMFVSFVNALWMLYLCYKNNVSVCVIGVPLLVYRFAGFFSFNHVRIVSYVRSVVVCSDNETSFSSNAYHRLRWICRGHLSRVISDYYADLVLCVGESTKKFIISRGVPESKIKVIGSIFCDTKFIQGQSVFKASDFSSTIVFISSAFSVHGYVDSQSEQTKFIQDIGEYLRSTYSNYEYNFIVRMHPRESEEVYHFLDANSGICVDSSGCDAVNGYSEGALFLSPISTLLFELGYLGKFVALISNEFFLKKHAAWYSSLGIKPVIDWQNLISNYMSGRFARNYKNFDGIISVQRRGRVVSDFSKIVWEQL